MTEKRRAMKIQTYQPPQCPEPDCEGRLIIRHTNRVGSCKVRYCDCDKCGSTSKLIEYMR